MCKNYIKTFVNVYTMNAIKDTSKLQQNIHTYD